MIVRKKHSFLLKKVTSKYLLEMRANMDTGKKYEDFALRLASVHGHLNIIEILLKVHNDV